MARPTTKEIRWFLEGPAPSEAWAWFDGLPGKNRTAAYPRQDIYLAVPGRDDLGLKLREGRLEIKVRSAAQTGVRLLGGRISGTCEDWEKFAWDYVDRIGEIQTPFRDGLRVRMVKSRIQRKYEIAEGKLAPVPMKPDRDVAFVVELTELFSEAVTGKDARGAPVRGWTLACEAIAPADKLDDAFETGTAALLAAYAGPELRPEDSFGYPRYALEIAGRAPAG